MASEILGLFTSPQQYQQNQLAQVQNRAFQEVQLSPFQQAALGARTAGYQLGQGIGGALGGQDPQLQLIARRQQLLSQLDQSDPASFARVAKMASDAGDQELAFGIAQAGREAAVKIAQANKERQVTDPFEQLVRSGKYTPASLSAYQKSGNVADLVLLEIEAKTPAKIQEAERVALGKGFARGTKEFDDAVNSYLERPERPEPRPSVGSDREGISLDLYNKNYYDLDQTERAEVNKELAKKRKDEAQAGAIMLPNQPVEPKDWIKFSDFINKDPLMSRTSTIISDAPAAIETIRTSTQNNFSAASLPAAIAKLTGEGKNMSNQDIERYTRIGGLDQRIAGDVVKFFTGKKTDATKAEAEQFAVALYRGALIERKKFIEDQAESTGYDQSPNYTKTIAQLDKKLAQFKLVTPSGSQSPSASQPPVFDAGKEKRYQEFKAKELAKQPKGTP